MITFGVIVQLLHDRSLLILTLIDLLVSIFQIIYKVSGLIFANDFLSGFFVSQVLWSQRVSHTNLFQVLYFFLNILDF